MAVPVQSKTVPQPIGTQVIPQNSLGILPGAGDAKQPTGIALPMPGNQQNQQNNRPMQNQSAYSTFHPAQKTAGLHPIVAPAVGGLLTLGATATGINMLRKKRREHLDKLRDNMWKEDAKNQALNMQQSPKQYFNG